MTIVSQQLPHRHVPRAYGGVPQTCNKQDVGGYACRKKPRHHLIVQRRFLTDRAEVLQHFVPGVVAALTNPLSLGIVPAHDRQQRLQMT